MFFSSRGFCIFLFGLVVALSTTHAQSTIASSSHGSSTNFNPKLLVRMTSGLIGNFGVGIEKPLSSSTSFGVDYRTESDSTSIIRGFDAFFRYYWWSSGTQVERNTSNADAITQHPTWMPYLGVEGMTRDYGVQRKGATSSGSATGSLAGFNGLVGLNVRVAQSFEVGAEAAIRLLSSFQTDAQVTPQSMIFIFTLNYLY